MSPEFKRGTRVVVQKKWFFCKPRLNDVIVLKDPRDGKLIIKRITNVRQNTTFYVLGDNRQQSTDSRVFGWVSKADIIGKVIYGFYSS